jgi:hypothetical protein
MLAQVLIGSDFRPKIVVTLICGDLPKYQVSNSSQDGK